ncbi:3-hydroxyacyl-CoA dehydrogenase [Geotalea uraniireducens]|uniref:3-hydroxyacyl-CoA dehydrogenase n=1 Tax=Geotalea uraniireducens TaxID=351604 RepID=A0ABM8EHN9_9BACT|nr:3-hydroxybutyryl-CoA dehydrogenase [Geotalea uraniireducens]BDV41927.1 3-hydroxyacyl-CoA dehydrogenase [Geotalea uraniireducens]
MIKTVGVLGAGQMGSGIAQLFAWHGYEVILCEIAAAQLAKAQATIRENLERQAIENRLEREEIGAIVARIRPTDSFAELAAAGLVIEAVPENEPLKRQIFRDLDAALPAGAILASNTSSISITRLAAATGRPERVLGLHFMNPVPAMRLVEVIRGEATSDETFAAATAVVASLGKEMAVSRDYPGFIVNRILIPMINEAIFALQEGVATAEAIDKGMKLGTNQPMGPLALADLIGLDTVLAIATVLYEGFRDPKYRPCPLLVRMVDAGHLGRKAGRGFFSYR